MSAKIIGYWSLLVLCVLMMECDTTSVNQAPTQKEMFLESARNFESKWITWYNRVDDVEADGPGATISWNHGIPYSVVIQDRNHEEIKEEMEEWTQESQEYWYEYQPGKVAFNYWDFYHIGEPSYPWPQTFDRWTGVNCFGFVYWCARNAGYNFINDSYKNGYSWVNAWKNVGVALSSWEDAETGDIIVFEWEKNDTMYHHMAIVDYVSVDPRYEDDIYIYHALGIYDTPHNFKVSWCTIGDVDTYLERYDNYRKYYRRLPEND